MFNQAQFLSLIVDKQEVRPQGWIEGKNLYPLNASLHWMMVRGHWCPLSATSKRLFLRCSKMRWQFEIASFSTENAERTTHVKDLKTYFYAEENTVNMHSSHVNCLRWKWKHCGLPVSRMFAHIIIHNLQSKINK